MGIKFASASSQYLYNASAVKTAVPFTMACWAMPADLSAGYCLMSLADTAGANDYFALYVVITTGVVRVIAKSTAVGAVNANTTNAMTVGKWHHLCGVFTSATDRKSYLDAGTPGTNTTDITPGGIDSTGIGVLKRATPTACFNGLIAEAAIWDVALTADEIGLLAQRHSPWGIRTDKLLAYWGCGNHYLDAVGSYPLTAANSPVVGDHPPGMIYPNDVFANWIGSEHQTRRQIRPSAD